mgnify:CR=1 FL=1
MTSEQLEKLFSSFTIGEMENPVTQETIKRKVEQIDGTTKTCKDCKKVLYAEDYRERIDIEGVGRMLMCEDCILEAEGNAKADWETMKDARS